MTVIYLNHYLLQLKVHVLPFDLYLHLHTKRTSFEQRALLKTNSYVNQNIGYWYSTFTSSFDFGG